MRDNSEYPELPEQNNYQEAKEISRYRWSKAAFAIISLSLLSILGYGIFFTSGILNEPSSKEEASFITILQPVQGSRLDMTWSVNVIGEAGGFADTEIIVQALDASGNVLAEQKTFFDPPESNTDQKITWSVDLRISTEPGTQGQIVAIAISTLDGGIFATDIIDVGYGETPLDEELFTMEDHFWRLLSLKDSSPIEDTQLDLQFDNFQASGSGGCNLFNTSYERKGNSLIFGLITSTAKECELPEGIMKQEAAYFDSLEQTAGYRLEGDRLVFLDPDGEALLVYAAVVRGDIRSTDSGRLPEQALVLVSLNDVSRAEAPSSIVAEQVIQDATLFPISYSIQYNPREIVADHRYTIGVRIEDRSGNLFFINPGTQQVITWGNPSQVDLTVEAIR